MGIEIFTFYIFKKKFKSIVFCPNLGDETTSLHSISYSQGLEPIDHLSLWKRYLHIEPNFSFVQRPIWPRGFFFILSNNRFSSNSLTVLNQIGKLNTRPSGGDFLAAIYFIWIVFYFCFSCFLAYSR